MSYLQKFKNDLQVKNCRFSNLKDEHNLSQQHYITE